MTGSCEKEQAAARIEPMTSRTPQPRYQPVDLTEGGQVVNETGRELEVEGEVAADESGQAGVGRAGVEDGRLVLLVRRLVLAELDDHLGPIWSHRQAFFMV